MRRIIASTSLAIGLLAFVLPVTSAQAQATRTWISGVGDDANPCSRTAPCKTFAGAAGAKTAAGGEIDTLDPGGFGAVTVTKAITLAEESTGEGGILVASTNGITVNAGASDVVIVRGMQIDGGPLPSSNSLAGIKFVAGGVLEVQNCSIRNFNGGSPNGYGIAFTPVGGGELDVSDTTITSNGQAGGGVSIGGGILIAPTGTPAVKFSINRTNIFDNTNGIRVDVSGATGGLVTGTIENTVIENSGFHGLAVNIGAGATVAKVVFDHSQSVNNTGDGIVSNGATSNILLNDSVVSGSGNFGVQNANSGVITSFKNNVIMGNHNDSTAALTPVTPS
jgi:hypothetical protein